MTIAAAGSVSATEESSCGLHTRGAGVPRSGWAIASLTLLVLAWRRSFGARIGWVLTGVPRVCWVFVFNVSAFVDRLEQIGETRGEQAVEDEYAKLGSEDRAAVLREMQARNALVKGRLEEAAPLWKQSHTAAPDDIWVYNNAGMEYGIAGHHATALAWLTPGLELAFSSGDPEQLTGQLHRLRQESLTALGYGGDTSCRPAPKGTSPQHGPRRSWPRASGSVPEGSE